MTDAHILMTAGRKANAGQLLFSVECGLKALLIACGVETDNDGGIKHKSTFKTHMPELNNRLVSSGHLIPDGQRPTHYRAMLPNVDSLSEWSSRSSLRQRIGFAANVPAAMGSCCTRNK
jgi:hypothetical protein